jgi:hypothetical protein
LAGFLQDDALKSDDIRIEPEVGIRHQRRVQPRLDVGIFRRLQSTKWGPSACDF